MVCTGNKCIRLQLRSAEGPAGYRQSYTVVVVGRRRVRCVSHGLSVMSAECGLEGLAGKCGGEVLRATRGRLGWVRLRLRGAK